MGYRFGKPAKHQKTRARVYDIVNAGPRHRFTAEGLLVSNCILDHSDNHLRLGLVTDIHHDRLDDGKRSKAERKPTEALPKECPSCAYLKPPRVHKCPACGFAPERRPEVDVSDGELVELRRDKGRGKVAAWTTEEKLRFYGELRWIAQERGYKEGWAAWKYKERIKVWPDGMGEPLLEPRPTTISWVKSRQIAHAKRRQKEARAA